jgi:hypothetical protein
MARVSNSVTGAALADAAASSVAMRQFLFIFILQPLVWKIDGSFPAGSVKTRAIRCPENRVRLEAS